MQYDFFSTEYDDSDDFLFRSVSEKELEEINIEMDEQGSENAHLGKSYGTSA